MLPAFGRAGQVIGLTDGSVWVWNTVWQELSQVPQVRYAAHDLGGITAGAGFGTYGTQVTFTAPGRTVLVSASFSCYVNSASGSTSVARQSLQISADNGATWSSPAGDKLATTLNTLTFVPMSDTWQVVASGTGIILVRSRVQSDSGSVEFHSGTLTAFCVPAV